MTEETSGFDIDLFAMKDESFYGVCRCCMATGNSTNMLITFEYLGLKENCVKMLYLCFGLNLLGFRREPIGKDTFLICNACKSQLKDSYAFRCQVIETQKSFENYVKLETEQDDNTSNKEDVVHDADWLSMDYSDGESFNGNVENENSQKRRRRKKDSSNTMDLDGSQWLEADICDIKQKTDSIFKKQKKKKDSKDIAEVLNDAVKEEIEEKSDGSQDDILPLILFKKKKFKKKHRKRRDSTPEPMQKKAKKITKLQIEKEILSNLDTENLQCKICTKVFLNLFLLRTHINVHYPNHICEVCGKGHATQTRLKNHQRMHIIGTFQCPVCGKTFSTKAKFDSHKGKHILPLRHVCPTCPERFANHYQKQKHLEVVHKVTLKRYNCESCPLNFTNSGALNNHKIRAHLQKKSHSCTLCNMSFYHKAELGKHMIVHTGERKYQCAICQKLYPRAYTLREHMKIHNNIKRHVCSECGRAFTQKCTLRGHMKVHGMALDAKQNAPSA